MKKLSFLLGISVLCATAPFALAKDKEVTIKGEAQCAKCSLHESKECASAIVTTKGGKSTTYYIVDNDTSKKLLPHKEVCTDKKMVTAKGTVKEVDGKKELTLTSIEDAK